MKYLSNWIIRIYVIAFVLTCMSIISPTTCTTTTRTSHSPIPSSSEKMSTAVPTTTLSSTNVSSSSSVKTSFATNSIVTNTVKTTTIMSSTSLTETLPASTSMDFLTDTSKTSPTTIMLSTSDHPSTSTPNVSNVSTVDFSSTITTVSPTNGTIYPTSTTDSSTGTMSTSDKTTSAPSSSTDNSTAFSTANGTTTLKTGSTTNSISYNATTSSSSMTTPTTPSSSITTPTTPSSSITTPTMSPSNTTATTMSSSNLTTPKMSSSNITTPTTSSPSKTTHTLPSTTNNTTDPTSYSTISRVDTSTITQSSSTENTTYSTSYGLSSTVSTMGIPPHIPSPTPDNTTAPTYHSSTFSSFNSTTNTPYASTGTTTDLTLYNTTVSTLGIIMTNQSTASSTSYSTMVSASRVITDISTSESANTTYSPLPSTTVSTSVETTDSTFSTTVYTTNLVSYNTTASTPVITTHLLIPTTPTTGSTTVSTQYNKPTSTTNTTSPPTVYTTHSTSYNETTTLPTPTNGSTISTPYNKPTSTTDTYNSTEIDTTTSVHTTTMTMTTPVIYASAATAPPVRTSAKPVTNASSTTAFLATNSTSTEIVIDGCAPSPCQNGANCTSIMNYVVCYCHAGFTGANCSIDINECASSSCQNGGTCVDRINGFKCICSPGYTDTTCSTIECGRVPNISNGTIISSNTTYGSLANVTCNTGYNTSTPVIQCLATGIWENSTCTAIDCGNSTETRPKNGTLETPATTTTYGSRFVYSCDKGYRNVGDSFKECLANGSWSSTAPNCSIRDCGSVLGTIQNGHMDNPTKTTTYGSVVNFTCNEDYTLIGVSSIQCTELGLWSGQIPTCHKDAPKTCKTENDSRGAAWTESPINTTALLRCAEGFDGNITRHCSVEGIWQLPRYSCIRTSIKAVNQTVANLTNNATTETVNNALTAITTETTRSQNSTADQKLTDGEITLLSTALEKVASVLSPLAVKNENITNSFIESASNLIDSTNKDSWKTLQSTNNGAEKVLSAVSSMGEALAESLKEGGNKTTIIKNNIAIEVKKIANDTVVFPDPNTHASDKDIQWIAESKSNIQLNSAALKGSNVTFITTAVMYRDMSEILSSTRSSINGSDEAPEEKEKINGPILALSITPKYNETLNPPVTITFKHQLTNYTSPMCSFWSFKNGSQGWSSDGCQVGSTNDSFTVCTCNHLTNFAILMSPFREADTSSKALRTISIVGISVSIVCLIAVFVLHFALWKYLRSDRTTVLMNLCVALLLSYIIFLAGVDRTESKAACTIIAAILHYIYLVVFCVMLVEGILIASIVHYVFNTKFRVKILLVIAWVLPAVIVGISLGASKTLGYGNNSVCWLSTDKGLIWAFVGPALIIITFNVLCILIVIRAIFSTKVMETKKVSEKVKTSLRSLAVLVPLMGISWVVGIFYVDESLEFIQYIFAILNGLQGFFIFLFHCPLNNQVKKGIRLWRRRTSWTWLRTTSGTTSSKYKDSNELRETDRSYVESADYSSRSNNDWREKALEYTLPTLPSTSWLNRSKNSASRLSGHTYNDISDDWTSPRSFSSQI